MKIHLNDGWMFSLGEPDNFTPVSLPHDWQIKDPKAWYQSGVGWYERKLETPYLTPDKRVFLRFDGVYMNSTLYVNGKQAGEWKYGFTAFEHDITDFLRADEENTLLVKVDACFPSARWYTGAGIYRDVSLIVKDKYHFVTDGIYITTKQTEDGQWTYEVSAEVETGGAPYEVIHTLLHEGEIIPWSPKQPQLYTLRSQLLVNGQVTDTMDTRFGFRSLHFSPDDGFAINGEKMKLNGVCLHQEFSIIGAAVHPDFIKRQILALKRMGVNAIRAAHNPPSAVLMDMADEMGMLVVSEFSDMWQLPKTEYDYARYFDAWHERDVASWIRRDRNRPSVIMWSLGNEIPDTHADYEKGSQVMRALQDLVRAHDPQGQALTTLGSNYMAWENTQKCAEEIGAVGYNYAEFLYNKHHEQFPHWIIYGSETCSTVQSRGIYRFPLRQSVLSDDDMQTSSLGNSTTSWGAKSIDDCIKDDRDTPFSLGQFVWTGQDYLGEPTPYHTKNSYFGMLDTAGFEKDGFYMFQSAWADPKQPVLHLFPYWDFNEGQEIDVRVCSNQHSVALYINDQLVGKQEMGTEITRNWVLPYQKGRLRADAFDKNGQLTASVERFSFGEASQLALTYEHLDELTFVSMTALDDQGLPVENANRLVRVTVKGAALLGLDNGDASDYTPYQHHERRLFSGKLLAVVKPVAGKEWTLEAAFVDEDIPVRRVNLTKEGYHVRANLLPENAAKQPLVWRLTNAAGVDSNIAQMQVDEDGQGVTVIPTGDGEVYVRCGVHNGKEHLDRYAQISYTIEGLGEAALNPFEFISAGLYSFSNVKLTNGNERGVATLRDCESWVCFDNLNFGANASDELSVWLFPLSHDPFHFEVWDGRPDQGGQILTRHFYDLGMIWNTYQEVRVKLNRALTGTASLCFVFTIKSHIKGFLFHQKTRSFEEIEAGTCEELYGDSFRRDGAHVLDIGNNTTLGFKHFDFGEMGTREITLTYDSENQKNPVQIRFVGEEGVTRVMLSVPQAKEKTTHTFPLDEVVSGKQDVNLVFLPGCKINLYSLRFTQASGQDN